MSQQPKKSPEPLTAVGAVSSAVAVPVASRRWPGFVSSHTMKTFASICSLVLVLLVGSSARAEGSSLELTLIDDRVVFITATNISMELSLRNVGNTNVEPFGLLSGLSVVLDGKEYKRDPKRFFSYDGLAEFSPMASMRVRFDLADYIIPPAALEPGRHTVVARAASSESNKLTFFIGSQYIPLAKDGLARVEKTEPGSP